MRRGAVLALNRCAEPLVRQQAEHDTVDEGAVVPSRFPQHALLVESGRNGDGPPRCVQRQRAGL
jgi:hypothetical protein